MGRGHNARGDRLTSRQGTGPSTYIPLRVVEIGSIAEFVIWEYKVTR